jgi:IMP dehydrogenase
MPVVNTDIVPVTEIMTRTAVTSRADSTVDSLIALMTQHHVGCIPIVDELGRPTGIVTKLDLIECRDEPRTTAREIMMPHAMTVTAEDTVARAASLMSSEQIHHLLVVDSNHVLIGVISTFDVTRWIARH